MQWLLLFSAVKQISVVYVDHWLRGTYPGPEAFHDFSSFREVPNTSREDASDSCAPLRGSLAALSCGEKSRKTPRTRVRGAVYIVQKL